MGRWLPEQANGRRVAVGQGTRPAGDYDPPAFEDELRAAARAEAFPEDLAELTDYGDPDEVLREHLRWLFVNAKKWLAGSKATPGVISEQILKNVDQRLDLMKLREDSDGDDDGLIGQIMAQPDDQ